MTISEQAQVRGAAAAAAPDLDAAYTRAIIDLHRSLRYPDLLDAVGERALAVVHGLGDGLTTVAFRPGDVRERHLDGVFGFRLAEFLAVELMDPRLARELALFGEPPDGTAVHTVSLDADGRIVGYIGLLGSADAHGRPLSDPARARFPAESAHQVDLLSPFAGQVGCTHEVFEIKRFVRAGDLPPGRVRDRIPWHLMLALGHAGLVTGTVRLLIGDSREDGALRHLRLLGFDPLVFPETCPVLPQTSLMWLSYTRAARAIPFAGLVPANIPATLELISEALADPGEGDWQRQLAARLLARGSGRTGAGRPGGPREELR
jgi:hypothetical protein